MGSPSHPKVVPWDQLFFLLKSPLYIVDFRHMNRGHFPNKAKSGKPAAHRFRTDRIRFWGTFRYILAKMLNYGPLGNRRPGLLHINKYSHMQSHGKTRKYLSQRACPEIALTAGAGLYVAVHNGKYQVITYLPPNF